MKSIKDIFNERFIEPRAHRMAIDERQAWINNYGSPKQQEVLDLFDQAVEEVRQTRINMNKAKGKRSRLGFTKEEGEVLRLCRLLLEKNIRIKIT